MLRNLLLELLFGEFGAFLFGLKDFICFGVIGSKKSAGKKQLPLNFLINII